MEIISRKENLKKMNAKELEDHYYNLGREEDDENTKKISDLVNFSAVLQMSGAPEINISPGKKTPELNKNINTLALTGVVGGAILGAARTTVPVTTVPVTTTTTATTTTASRRGGGFNSRYRYTA